MILLPTHNLATMHTRLLALACLVTATTFAADAPKLPAIAASGNE